MPIDLIIFGAGGMGRETKILVEDINKVNNQYSLRGFAVDDEFYQSGIEIEGLPLYSKEWLLKHKDDVMCICSIGYPLERRKVMQDLKQNNIRFATLIHPTASYCDIDYIGNGSIINSYSSLSTGAKIGEGVVLNGSVNIGHDAILEDYVTCFPKSQISGGCYIEEAVSVGSMSYIHEKKRIGKETVVVPGSIVLRNVKPNKYVMGNPARIIDL